MPEYYSESEIIQGKFIIASYKHEDSQVVLNTVNYLIDQGVRLWFDEDLQCGDDWDEKVKKLINHENCLGIIFFNSKDSFASDAVEKERQMVMAKLAAFKAEGKTFEIFPLSIGQRKTMELIKAMLEANSFETVAQDAEKFSVKIQTVLELFKDNKTFIFVDSESDKDYRQELLSAIETKLPDVVTSSKHKLNRLRSSKNAKNVGNLLCIDFGFEKKRPAPNISGSRLKQGNKIIQYNDEYFMIRNETAYTVKALEWLCLYCEDNAAVMITKDIIDEQKGGAALDDWLKNVFFTSAFTEEQQKAILELRLLNQSDIEKSEDKAFLMLSADSQKPDCKWWISYNGSSMLQKAVKENGKIYENGYNVRTMALGVRPVIKISIDIMYSFLEDNI